MKSSFCLPFHRSCDTDSKTLMNFGLLVAKSYSDARKLIIIYPDCAEFKINGATKYRLMPRLKAHSLSKTQ